MPKAALYARYSSDLQNPQSIDDQIRECRQYAVRKGWDVVHIYDDEAISGAAVRSRAGMLRLLDDARARRFDMLCAEALDRISRDQEDIAHVYKLLRFKDIGLHTLAEGPINEIHIGLKGTMNAIFLNDLAAKTRRGQRGRGEKGRSGGGLAYGYDVVTDERDGAGGRIINEDHAKVVRRIFRDFAGGATPGAIADMLNRDGVPGPGGRSWKPTTIRGHRIRGTGIINNELYRGVLVWNRQRFVREPVTGKRQARMNPEDDWVRKDVPELRIVDEGLWRAVKNRQDEQEQEHGTLRDAVRKAREAKSRDLTFGTSNFAKLLICAACSADFSPVGRDRYGCADHYRRKTCANGQTLPRRVMEEQVRAFFAETSALIRSQAVTAGQDADLATRQLQGQMVKERRELEVIETRLSGLLTAIEDGLHTPRMKLRFQQIEDQAQKLKARLQIGAEQMKTVQTQTGANSAEAITSLMVDLRTSDDEYKILKLRRLLGPISVTPSKVRADPSLKWENAAGRMHKRQTLTSKEGHVMVGAETAVS